MSKKKTETRPHVLVTVSGGVATVWESDQFTYDLVDWDNWECDIPTKDDILQLKDVAKRLSARDKEIFLREVKELEDKFEGEIKEDEED